MKIRCRDLESFLKNLEDGHVHRDTVHVDCYEVPLNGTKYNAVSFQICFAAYAVLIFDNESEALLEVDEECGVDRRTVEDVEMEGSRYQADCLERLRVFCNERGLSIKPGILEE